MEKLISISSIASISALGDQALSIQSAYDCNQHLIKPVRIGKQEEWVAPLKPSTRATVEQWRLSKAHYENLDRSVLYALYTSRKAFDQCKWKTSDHIGINIGSSRGATALFENYHQDFLKTGKSKIHSSPTTTLGNISSWVAQELRTNGPVISHSITCSTALHALMNGVAWIRSGMADKFIAGGSEAALTPFTIAQMKALRIYSDGTHKYPCRALDFDKKRNSMILGEGAAVACIEPGISDNNLAIIEGLGYATETLSHQVSISSDARCFQESMQMALQKIKPEQVDTIIMHAPGTVKGDLAEWKAVQKVFGNKIPAITSNKWKIGHTFAASGMLSIEMAILMMQRQQFIGIPYINFQKEPKQLNKILVNAVGFGGNAVSVLLSTETALN